MTRAEPTGASKTGREMSDPKREVRKSQVGMAIACRGRKVNASNAARFAAKVNSSSAAPSIKSKTTLGTRLRANPRRSSILTARGGTILRDLFIQSSILATAISGFDLGTSKPKPASNQSVRDSQSATVEERRRAQ